MNAGTVADQKVYGTRSFVWITLGMLLEIVDRNFVEGEL